MKNLESARPFTSMEIVADLQTEIKLLIKNTVFRVSEWSKFQKQVDEMIEAGLKELKNEAFKETAKRTLKRFADIEFEKLVKAFDFGSLPLIVALSGALIETRGLQEQINQKVDAIPIRRIEGGFTSLASSTPKVEDRQSLYGYAEMQERYEEAQDKISSLKKETNLVICGTHANCSDRCFKWQGRVYSLDGTYGTTSDGRKYVPLEVATQARDKYGNVNGLLGYNCRHYKEIVPYKDGLRPIVVTKEEQKRQYELNNKQRLYERKIREYKEKAELSILESAKYRAKSTELAKEYKEFCHKNNVVEYRSRLKI